MTARRPRPPCARREYTYDAGGEPPHGPGHSRHLELQRPQRAAGLQRHHLRVRPERQPDLAQRRPGPDLRVGRGEPAHVRARQRGERRVVRVRPLGAARWRKTTSLGLPRASPTTARTSWWRRDRSGTFTNVHGSRHRRTAGPRVQRGAHPVLPPGRWLGSLVKITDAGGNVEGSRSYDSFGQPTPPANGYAFTSREWTARLGCTTTERGTTRRSCGILLSEDPVDFQDGLSRYAYVLGNPVNLIDPTGWVAQPTMKCGGECPPDVMNGARDGASAAGVHPDAWVRRCMAKQCRSTKITRLSPDDPICQMRSSSGHGARHSPTRPAVSAFARSNQPAAMVLLETRHHPRAGYPQLHSRSPTRAARPHDAVVLLHQDSQMSMRTGPECAAVMVCGAMFGCGMGQEKQARSRGGPPPTTAVAPCTPRVLQLERTVQVQLMQRSGRRPASTWRMRRGTRYPASRGA